MTSKELFAIDSETFKHILKYFDKNEKTLETDVEILRKWTDAQPHFPYRLEKRILENFLILNKFSIEQSKEKIDAYFTVRSKVDIYQEINPKLPQMQEMMDTIYLTPYPKLTKNFHRVVFIKARKNTLMKQEPVDIVRQMINFQEIRLRKDLAFGEVFVIDVENFNPVLSKVTPSLVYKSLVLVYQRVFSFRLKAAYFINSPPIVHTILAIIKTFVKPKMVARIHVCSLDKVKEELSDDLLPKDFGGSGPSLEELREMTNLELMQNQNLFDELDKMRVDEAKRPQALRNDESLGFYGNFKKLDID